MIKNYFLPCRLFSYLSLLSIMMLYGWKASAQLPNCGTAPYYIYLQSGNNIYDYDPTMPISASNPFLNTIALPSGSGGLAVGPNLNAATPATTFYTTVGGTFYYYNGTGWTNTGHSTSNGGAVNIGAGGGYIYNLVGSTGQVYIYNGTGAATLLTTVTGFNGGGPYDLQVDCAGNWYILCTSPLTNQYMREYSPTGVLIHSWVLSGAPNTTAGGGFAIIGTTIYYHNNTPSFVTGVINATNDTVVITSIAAGLSSSPGDFGTCPIGGIVQTQRHDTVYYCGNAMSKTLSAPTGVVGPYTWTVLNGPAAISGSGSTITFSAAGNATIALSATSAGICGSTSTIFTDTFAIRYVGGVANAGGPSDSISGCGVYADSLHGTFSNATPGYTYSIAWTPTATITSGANTLRPHISPVMNTRYYLTVTTPANTGGCAFKDSVNVAVVDKTVHADFNFDIHYGCKTDTVHLFNFSVPNNIITRHIWDFHDGSGDTAKNPVHVYPMQAAHSISLLVSNATCRDSVTKPVDTQHPLHAAFTQDRDSVCEAHLITFTDQSVTTTKFGINPSFYWDFRDGTSSTLQNPTHTFSRTGSYNVTEIVKDFVPCYDTAYHTILVDSLPHAHIFLTDSALCEGQGIIFDADFLAIGNTGYTWTFGDGTTISNQHPITHSYDSTGVFTVKFSATYRICPDTSDTRTVSIKPFPMVDLGRDTGMCLNAAPIYLVDAINANTPGASFHWNTGDTGSHIQVVAPGTYSVTVDIDGCKNTDSITISKDCYIDIPNSFTPNNDGLDDYFFPRQFLSHSVATFSMDIYDRWGELIFRTTSIDGRGWDGKFNGSTQPVGVYIYLINVSFVNGRTEKYQGNVTLLR